MSPVRVVAGLLLVGFVPGFLLVQAAFPRGLPHGGRPGSRASLTVLVSVILSLALATLAGLVLGFLPAGEGRGFFQGSATGAPYIEAVLLTLSGVLFAAAYVRGAFPRLAGLVGWIPERGPGEPHAPPSRRPTLAELADVRRGETALTLRILALRLRTFPPQPASARESRREAIAELREERAELRGRARDLEEELARSRFGGSP